MQTAGRDLSTTSCHYCNEFGYYKNDCAGFKAVRQQNQRRHNCSTSSETDISRISRSRGGQQQQKGGRQMWCSYNKLTTHSNVDCRARSANRPNGNVHFTRVRPPSVLGIFLCTTTPTRSPVIHSRREGSSLQLRPPKPKWRRRRGPGYSAKRLHLANYYACRAGYLLWRTGS